jgi:predicted transcriptional regulator
MADEPDDMAQRLEAAGRRLAEMSAAMDETKRRQDEIQRRQEELLDQLGRLSRAMDREGDDGEGSAGG